MEQDQINRNNLLIAAFMGFTVDKETKFLVDPEEGPNPMTLYCPDGSDFKYHKDWTSLMKVAEKLLGKTSPIEEAWKSVLKDILKQGE